MTEGWHQNRYKLPPPLQCDDNVRLDDIVHDVIYRGLVPGTACGIRSWCSSVEFSRLDFTRESVSCAPCRTTQ